MSIPIIKFATYPRQTRFRSFFLSSSSSALLAVIRVDESISRIGQNFHIKYSWRNLKLDFCPSKFSLIYILQLRCCIFRSGFYRIMLSWYRCAFHFFFRNADFWKSSACAVAHYCLLTRFRVIKIKNKVEKYVGNEKKQLPITSLKSYNEILHYFEESSSYIKIQIRVHCL